MTELLEKYLEPYLKFLDQVDRNEDWKRENLVSEQVYINITSI